MISAKWLFIQMSLVIASSFIPTYQCLHLFDSYIQVPDCVPPKGNCSHVLEPKGYLQMSVISMYITISHSDFS